MSGRGTGGAAPGLEGRTILVLEDEPLIVVDLEYALVDAGARVLVAARSADALALLDAERIDGAVLDLTLGGEDTCEAVALRLIELGIPYLLHTGDEPRHGALLARLAAPRIAKPYPSVRLAARLERLLEHRPRLSGTPSDPESPAGNPAR